MTPNHLARMFSGADHPPANGDRAGVSDAGPVATHISTAARKVDAEAAVTVCPLCGVGGHGMAVCVTDGDWLTNSDDRPPAVTDWQAHDTPAATGPDPAPGPVALPLHRTPKKDQTDELVETRESRQLERCPEEPAPHETRPAPQPRTGTYSTSEARSARDGWGDARGVAPAHPIAACEAEMTTTPAVECRGRLSP